MSRWVHHIEHSTTRVSLALTLDADLLESALQGVSPEVQPVQSDLSTPLRYRFTDFRRRLKEIMSLCLGHLCAVGTASDTQKAR